MDKPAPDRLKAIRERIDTIDETMHRLLIDRSGVIAELIRVKGTSKPGAAFRPDREADMMRRIVGRHSGDLPLATVEHIWREIISTFTAMQAPYGVVTGPSSDPLAMRDLARFYFGFAVPVTTATSDEEAIATVEGSLQQLALIAADGSGERWWSALAPPNAPKIFAKLPFLEIPDRPAALPAYVVGPPLEESPQPDIQLLALADHAKLSAAVAAYGGAIVGRAAGEALIELPSVVDLDDIAKDAGGDLGRAVRVGSFFQQIRFLAERAA